MMHSIVKGYKYVEAKAEKGNILQPLQQQQQQQHQQQPQNHPDLENLYFIDRLTNGRIHPNAGIPITIDNDIFSGKLLIMVRTSDADEDESTTLSKGSPTNDIVSNYLRPKLRRFEIQLQMKFKKVPLLPPSSSPNNSRIFLCCGYEEPVKLNFLSKTSLAAALRFCKMRNPSFSYSLSGGNETVNEKDKQIGNYEKPHFAFPMETSMDAIVITKEGDTPPTLGSRIEEDKTALMKRRKEGLVYNTNDTYTVCLWNSYVDFCQWKALNIPAVPKFSLANINNAQPMSVKIYSLDDDDSNNNGHGYTHGRQHLLKDQRTILDVEVSHREVTTIGHGAKIWMKNCRERDNVNANIDETPANTTTTTTSAEEEITNDKKTSMENFIYKIIDNFPTLL